MVAYQQFVEFSQSSDSEDRGSAAHLAALAYLSHVGPADEQAALYAALVCFLDDPSVKVRAALAYGLLHSVEAPRPIMLALLNDAPIIARAVLQYSPALIDADMVGLLRTADVDMLLVGAQRQTLSVRMIGVLLARTQKPVTLRLLGRADLSILPAMLVELARHFGDDADLRGAMLKRRDLPAEARLMLVQAATQALAVARIVKGAIAEDRLTRLLRNCADTAVTSIGEYEAARASTSYAEALVDSEKLSTRLMLHAVVNGHVFFFADCVAQLSDAPREKIFGLLESGSRAALNALFVRCGLNEAVRNLIVRLVFHARTANLADDVGARHFVVTALTEELILEHDGVIPPELEEAFAYLSEQNVALARKAARGVMAAFARDSDAPMPSVTADDRVTLPAA